MVRCMQRTNIFLEERQTAALDELARTSGVSRAEVIRRVIDRFLAGQTDSAAADHAAIDVAFGAVVEMELADRGIDARAKHLAALWGREA